MITDYFIEPGDYLKIDNVTLGYTMNLNKKYIEKIRLFGTANNLYTFTKFTGVDPSTYEVNGLTLSEEDITIIRLLFSLF